MRPVELVVEKQNVEVVQIKFMSATSLLDGTGATVTNRYQRVHPVLTRVLITYAVSMK